MNLTATHIAYFQVCKRKLWLFHYQISMEQTSDTVSEGKLIGETTYLQRPEKYTEVALSVVFDDELSLHAKIDFFDANNKVVHEIKKTDKLEHAHIAQVKFYLYVLEKNNIEGCAGILEYPKLKQTLHIDPLTEVDRVEIEENLADIRLILAQENCPSLVKKSYCKTCSYFDFCFVN
ncbi:MAG: CRISPR-associated protein Cas4 [Cytophagales bacterium]|nr:MAG: CRISPR-associated protein Cas4 [Cytophagales bacterium]